VRGGDGLDTAGFLARGALLVAVTLILANKVGSPQFVGWLAGPVVVGLARPGAAGLRAWRLPALLVLVIAALTQLVFPVAYDAITLQQTWPSLVLAARNVLLVVLAVVLARDLLRTGRAAGRSRAGDVSAAAA
jgi:hypothetical protein